jgi:hypothetical protein
MRNAAPSGVKPIVGRHDASGGGVSHEIHARALIANSRTNPDPWHIAYGDGTGPSKAQKLLHKANSKIDIVS